MTGKLLKLKSKAEELGYDKCEWEPAENDEGCERCGDMDSQLYYKRTCIEHDEGEYHCLSCINDYWKLLEEYQYPL